MNIFALSDNPKTAAELHFDKHVIKMILETAQLISTAHHVLDQTNVDPVFYKKTHVNHPSAIWVRENLYNYFWAVELFKELCIEYKRRYGRDHATNLRLGHRVHYAPRNIPQPAVPARTPFACAMPDEIKNRKDLSPVDKYLLYYRTYKWGMFAYKNQTQFQRDFWIEYDRNQTKEQ